MNMKPLLRAAGAALLLIPVASTAQNATPFFMTLPPSVLPYDVGANGWVSVGAQYGAGGMYWMPTTGATKIGGNGAVAVSRDGKRIVGSAFDAQGHENAAIWTGGTTWRLLGSLSPTAQPCDLNYSAAFGANADASVIVGLAWDGCKIARAFRWQESTGLVDLGSLTGESTRANAVSGDGQIVVGWEEALTGPRQGAKWVRGAEELIKRADGGWVGEASATNSSGSIIVGTNCTPESVAGSPAGWMWTQGKGVQCYTVDRPRWLPPHPYSVLMSALSDDGRVVGGAYSFGLDAEALIWLDGQVYFLKDYLRNNGYPDAFAGWVNTGFITGVTPDGRTLVGYGAGPTTFTGYMVILPDRGKQ